MKEVLGVVEFAKELLRTEDLDPLYVLLHKTAMPREKLCRWLVAYWCYYHAGLCCWIVDQPDFFKAMMTVAKGGTRFPRGSERRHFRGKLAIDSVAKLKHIYGSAEVLVNLLIDAGPLAADVMERVTELHGFGIWISWKVPDMIERLGLAKLKFVEEDLERMFDSSLKGAVMVHIKYNPEIEPNVARQRVWAHRFLLRRLAGLDAPPLYDRALNVQETETIFCKWKAHLGGHYLLGKDTHEIKHGLLRYGRCKTSQRMLKAAFLHLGVGSKHA